MLFVYCTEVFVFFSLCFLQKWTDVRPAALDSVCKILQLLWLTLTQQDLEGKRLTGGWDWLREANVHRGARSWSPSVQDPVIDVCHQQAWNGSANEEPENDFRIKGRWKPFQFCFQNILTQRELTVTLRFLDYQSNLWQTAEGGVLWIIQTKTKT